MVTGVGVLRWVPFWRWITGAYGRAAIRTRFRSAAKQRSGGTGVIVSSSKNKLTSGNKCKQQLRNEREKVRSE